MFEINEAASLYFVPLAYFLFIDTEVLLLGEHDSGIARTYKSISGIKPTFLLLSRCFRCLTLLHVLPIEKQCQSLSLISTRIRRSEHFLEIRVQKWTNITQPLMFATEKAHTL